MFTKILDRGAYTFLKISLTWNTFFQAKEVTENDKISQKQQKKINI